MRDIGVCKESSKTIYAIYRTNFYGVSGIISCWSPRIIQFLIPHQCLEIGDQFGNMEQEKLSV